MDAAAMGAPWAASDSQLVLPAPGQEREQVALRDPDGAPDPERRQFTAGDQTPNLTDRNRQAFGDILDSIQGLAARRR